MKLGVIVPYRKRPTHLRRFRESIESYLKGQDYELIVVEQADDLPFNRGKLLNIGFRTALRKQCRWCAACLWSRQQQWDTPYAVDPGAS